MTTGSILWTSRLRTIAMVIACWAALNCLAFLVLLEHEVGKESGKRRPSFLSRQQYSSGMGVARQGERENRHAIRYRMSHPVNGTPERRFPLVVFLHGSGERGSDNESQLMGLPEQMVEENWRRRLPCYLLAPQCPQKATWADFSDELVDIVRDTLRRHPIDAGRVYLTGLSMGGFGCWSLAEKEPQLFAAVVPICGGGDLTHADRLVSTPIWAVHGDADRTVPVQLSRQMIEAIRQAGGNPKYTELKNVGHDSWTQTYQDPDGLLKWMFSQRNTKASAHPQ